METEAVRNGLRSETNKMWEGEGSRDRGGGKEREREHRERKERDGGWGWGEDGVQREGEMGDCGEGEDGR